MSRPSRILLVLSDPFGNRGAVPRFNRMLCLALDALCPQMDLEVQVVVQGETAEDCGRAGEPWKHLEFVPGGGRISLTRKTFTLAKSLRPDLLLLGQIGMTPTALLCAPFVGRGFGFVWHGVGDRREQALAGARRASVVFAVSRQAGRQLCDLTGLRAGSIVLLPNTVDPDFVGCADPGREARPESLTELLSVSRSGSAEELEGVNRAIRSFAKLAPRHPRAHYRIVGIRGDKERLERLAASLGVEHRMLFEQDLDESALAERYRRCTAFVLPDGQGESGLVFLEAMGFANPCVGADHGISAELIVHDQTGYLVPSGDDSRLTAALDRLLAAPELCADLGIAGRQRLIEQFTFERFHARLERHLHDLLARN